MSNENQSTCGCKIGRKAEAYNLANLDIELQRRYIDHDESLRTLSDHVNVAILESALDRTDANIVGDPVSIHEALVGDDVAPERRADVTDQLEYAGIDLDRITGDFVSHQTVKTHLNKCLKVDTSRKGVDSIADGRQVIEWARERDEHIIEQTLAQLRRADVLDSGPLEITQTVTVRCTDCGETFRLNELLDDSSCSCSNEQ